MAEKRFRDVVIQRSRVFVVFLSFIFIITEGLLISGNPIRYNIAAVIVAVFISQVIYHLGMVYIWMDVWWLDFLNEAQELSLPSPEEFANKRMEKYVNRWYMPISVFVFVFLIVASLILFM